MLADMLLADDLLVTTILVGGFVFTNNFIKAAFVLIKLNKNAVAIKNTFN
jgi:hypothetical protein